MSNRFTDIEHKIVDILNFISLNNEPEIEIGEYCKKPFECPMKEHCWAFLPEGSVYDLYYGGKKSFDLFQSGVLKISDIPDDYNLSANQEIQKACAVNDQVHINKEKIKGFLDSLSYPLYYLDFETINPVVPPYKGIKPYQKVPFQFSLHIQEAENEDAEHVSLLAEGIENPFPEILQSLKDNLSNTGDIIVYNASFEEGILKDGAEMYPEYSDWYESNILPRIKDLLAPFRSFYYYDSKQKGSMSI